MQRQAVVVLKVGACCPALHQGDRWAVVPGKEGGGGGLAATRSGWSGTVGACSPALHEGDSWASAAELCSFCLCLLP